MPKHEPVAAAEPWIDNELEQEEPEGPEGGGLAAEAADGEGSAAESTETEEPESKALAAEAADGEGLGDETLEAFEPIPPEDEASKPPGT